MKINITSCDTLAAKAICEIMQVGHLFNLQLQTQPVLTAARMAYKIADALLVARKEPRSQPDTDIHQMD